MQSPTLDGNRAPKLVSHTHYCVVGDGTVANSAAIAPGVVLQASPGSRIIVAEGACLAGGVCIQSRQGLLTIGAGASLGANVLVVGHGTVGENACLSPGSTVMNPQIGANALVSPGSLVASESSASNQFTSEKFPAIRSVSNNSQQNNTHQNNTQNGASSNGSNRFSAGNGFTSGSYVDTQRSTYVEPPPVGPRAIETPSLSDQNGQYVDPASQNDGVQSMNSIASSNGSTANSPAPNSSGPNSSALSVQSNDRVYGKDQVSQLLSTLFPHRQT